MIEYNNSEKFFHLYTDSTSYIIRIYPSNHLGHVYYGARLKNLSSIEPLLMDYDIEIGNQVVYQEEDRNFNLNFALLENSTYGKGDFRAPSQHFRFDDGSRVSDFTYERYEITEGVVPLKQLPSAHLEPGEEKVKTLMIVLADHARKLLIELYYTVFESKDIIVRKSIIKNESPSTVIIEKAMSMQIDMLNKDYDLISFDGAWIRERYLTKHSLSYGTFLVDSKKGVSSNDHNPSFVICEKNATELSGEAFGFALTYSGNFEASAEVSPHQLLRVLFGVNSFDFYYELLPSSEFETPEVVLSYSNQGFSKMSQHFHEFVKKNLIQPQWYNKERPIVLNNWEATYFNFNERKLMALVKKAKKVGIEMFVLDDGWFGHRDNDQSSLGDFFVDRKKLPKGLEHFVKQVNQEGLEFGIWMEPEMVSEESELYRLHPEWAIKHPLYKPSLGRHQLNLDLSNQDVVEYLFHEISSVLLSANIKYVKWDMNRNFSDLYSTHLSSLSQGAFSYLYYVGLYQLLKRLTSTFPDILFEGCASGGNRFDYGILCYMPQIWTSDDTDGIERLKIHYGTSYFYPTAVISAHVSEIPNQQTLRQVPIETRFNTASFGLLGYELDLTKVTPYEIKVIRNQISFYKKYRKTLQFGQMTRYSSPFEKNTCSWSVISHDQRQCLYGLYHMAEQPNQGPEILKIKDVNSDFDYQIENRKQFFNVSKFGHLVDHALPIHINANKLLFLILKNHYLLPIEKEDKIISGEVLLHHGFYPKQNFIGTGYHDKIRLMGDYESRVYIINEKKENVHEKNNLS